MVPPWGSLVPVALQRGEKTNNKKSSLRQQGQGHLYFMCSYV